MKALLSLNKYLYKYRGRLLLGFIITIGARVFAVFTPQLIRNSTVAIEDYLNGDIVNIAEVKEELLINIGLIVGAALASRFSYLYDETVLLL